MKRIPYIFFILFSDVAYSQTQHAEEKKIIHELFRLRNEGKPDSVEHFYADTVKVYMKTLRNVPKQTITKLDRIFFKQHPKNKFEMTKPVEIVMKDGIVAAIIIGKEFLDGTSFKYERIEIRFNRRGKIDYFRAFNIKG
jgi:hypothetical protein